MPRSTKKPRRSGAASVRRTQRPKDADPATAAPANTLAAEKPARRRGNSLDGKRWLQNSISVWGDIRKSADEMKLNHPALFPSQLVLRLIESFAPPGARLIADPFAGSGSTLVAAAHAGIPAIGMELSPTYAELARTRLAAISTGAARQCAVHQAPASELERVTPPESVDFCLTSPPYWNILTRSRTADAKDIRNYGNQQGDLGVVDDYEQYLDGLEEVFQGVFRALRPGAYCCVVVMDLRKKDRFYPLHSDLAARMQAIGFEWDDLIIWNRQSEYNNLRPLGYPSVFRVNKVHEYVLIFQKRQRARAAASRRR